MSKKNSNKNNEMSIEEMQAALELANAPVSDNRQVFWSPTMIEEYKAVEKKSPDFGMMTMSVTQEWAVANGKSWTIKAFKPSEKKADAPKEMNQMQAAAKKAGLALEIEIDFGYMAMYKELKDIGVEIGRLEFEHGREFARINDKLSSIKHRIEKYGADNHIPAALIEITVEDNVLKAKEMLKSDYANLDKMETKIAALIEREEELKAELSSLIDIEKEVV